MTSRCCRNAGLALLSTFALVARAVTVPDLYETAQPVGGSRDAAFVEALQTVVVRVSGQRDAPARLAAELNNPRKYVQRFGFTADNILQVGFDSVSVDQLLSEAGLPIWGRERPATLVLLGVDAPDGGVRWLSADASASEREAISKIAHQRGLPLIWATLDGQDQVAAGGDVAASTAPLLQTAQRHGANAALIGRVRGGAVRWTLISADGAAETVGGLDEGVHLAADTFARLFATTGSVLGDVTVEVSGVVDLNAYASTLNYLESMTLVRGVAVEQVAGDTLRFRLAVRGDAATLKRAIALDNRLVPLTGSDLASSGEEHLSFRYQP
jgi:hypothetical protein